jgi:hypothetical protein
LGDNFGRIANAKIPEVIGYERDLTTDEKRKVNTYLAIKYGVTLVHDYISPSGAVLYSVGKVYKTGLPALARSPWRHCNRSSHVVCMGGTI